jgi:hypothetical protein
LGSNHEHLADPELYIIVNGQPTKNRVVWRSLVDVNAIKAAVQKLGELRYNKQVHSKQPLLLNSSPNYAGVSRNLAHPFSEDSLGWKT